MTVTLLVQMISLICIENADKKSAVYMDYKGIKVYTGQDSVKSLDVKLDCFDHFNNCMVGPGGVIKASDWKVCKKSWEKKNK